MAQHGPNRLERRPLETLHYLTKFSEDTVTAIAKGTIDDATSGPGQSAEGEATIIHTPIHRNRRCANDSESWKIGSYRQVEQHPFPGISHPEHVANVHTTVLIASSCKSANDVLTHQLTYQIRKKVFRLSSNIVNVYMSRPLPSQVATTRLRSNMV